MAFSFNAAKGRSLPATWLGALAACNCSWAELLGEFLETLSLQKNTINKSEKGEVYISLSLSMNKSEMSIVYSLSIKNE